jgi:hypothetical protein
VGKTSVDGQSVTKEIVGFFNLFDHCPVTTALPVCLCYCFTLAHYNSQKEDAEEVQRMPHCW